jgi:hypothetical protein
MKRSPIRRVRQELRRGEPTPEEKQATREAVHHRANGHCELRLSPNCTGQRYLPLEGDEFTRMHLVHGHAKARFGWRESETNFLLCGCIHCHSMAHTKGIKLERPDRPILKLGGY